MRQDSFDAGGAAPLNSASKDNLSAWQCANAPYESRQPGCIKLEQTVQGLKIVYRWYSPDKVLGILFPGLFLVFVIAMGGWSMVVEVPLFALLFFSIPVVMIYIGLANMLNRTEIVLGLDGIKISVKPIPWPGRKRIPSMDIAQLYVDEFYVRRKNGQSTYYRLNAIMRDGRKLVLIQSFKHYDPGIAKFVERVIEDQLHIRNEPVAGEVE